VLIGLVGATALTLAAGWRRTASAHHRFLDANHAYDAGIITFCGRGVRLSATAKPGCRDEVSRLPAIAESTVVTRVPALIETRDGTNLQPEGDPCYTGPGEVALTGDASGRFGSALNRADIVAGHRPDPSARNDVLVSEATANRLQLVPGDHLEVDVLGGVECGEQPRGSAFTLRIVGIQLSPGEVRPPSGPYAQSVTVTPAFIKASGGQAGDEYLVVRMRPGATIQTLEDQATDAGLSIVVLISRADNEEAVDRAIRPTAVSLGVLALLTAFAGIAVLGQVLVRFSGARSPDEETLASVGMSRSNRFALAMLRAATVAMIAAVVAVGLAYLGSLFMPTGVARTIESSHKLRADGIVLGFGAAGIALFVLAVCAVPAWRVSRVLGTTAEESRVSRSRIADVAAGAGGSPAVVSGTRLALERGAGRSAVPVLTSFAGLAIAITAVVGAVTFAAGMDHVRSTPRLIGWNWDAIVGIPNIENAKPPVRPEVVRARIDQVLEGHPSVAAYAMGSYWPPFINGNPLLVGPKRVEVDPPLAFDGDADVGPSVISGRKPVAPNEILLGPASLAEVGVRIGDEVDVVSPGTWTAPQSNITARMRVVGTGTVPKSERLGKGSAMTNEGLARLAPGFGVSAIYVRLASQTDASSVTTSLERAFPEAEKSDEDEVIAGDLPDAALNLDQIDAAPWLFAAEMGLIGAAVLGYVLLTAVGARRRDLGLLRVFGFSHAQTERTVAYQSLVYAIGASIIGCPLGIALGRVAWTTYAETLGVVPEPVTPWTAVLVVVAVALLAAILLSIVPGRVAARRRLADLLRTE
jgi:ABC-type antimicrobial peptide transport system permease subunit